MRKNYHSINKYHNHKVEIDGMTFDSQREYRRYRVLKDLERIGKIKNLERQVKFVLTPTVSEPDHIGPRGGVHKGRVILQESAYYADFVYTVCATGEMVIEDCKGFRTPDYILKKKMLYQVTKEVLGHGIVIKET